MLMATTVMARFVSNVWNYGIGFCSYTHTLRSNSVLRLLLATSRLRVVLDYGISAVLPNGWRRADEQNINASAASNS